MRGIKGKYVPLHENVLNIPILKGRKAEMKMTNTESKNNLIKWLVLLIDVFGYGLLVHVVVAFFPEYVSPAVLHHPDIASIFGMLCMLLFSLIWPPVIYRRRLKFKDVCLRNIVVIMFAQLVFGFLWHLITVNDSNEISYNVMMIVCLFVLLFVFRVIERIMLGAQRSKGRNTRSVMFIGSDPANKAMYDELMSDPTTGYRVVGYYSDQEIEDIPENFKKLGDRDDFRRILAGDEEMDFAIDELYCSLSHAEDAEIRKIIRFCDKEMIRFVYVPRIFQNMQLSLKPEIIGNNVVYTTHHEPLLYINNKVIKRAFDVIFSIIVLVLLVPFVPIIMLVVKMQSPGPLLFRQKRTGMNGIEFTCYKFRSMHVNDNADKVQATKDDPRKFSFGDFMRKYNIDELPQFYNVLKGDMSIVGPRPHMTLHTEKYSTLIEKYMVRHFAKPGITGLAQVTGFRGETEELWQMEGRIRKDIWYIENWTFWLDVKICFKTLGTMIWHDENAY